MKVDQKNPSLHLYLYAKGFYTQTDLVKDLAALILYQYAYNPSVVDIVEILMNGIFRYILSLEDASRQYEFRKFMLSLSDEELWKLGLQKDVTYFERIMRSALSIMRQAEITQ